MADPTTIFLRPSSATYSSLLPTCKVILHPDVDAETRDEAIQNLVNHLIDSPREWPKVGKALFAVRHLAPQLGVLNFQGTSTKMSASYWRALLEYWKRNECFFIESKLPARALDLIDKNVSKFSDFLATIYALYLTKKSEIQLSYEPEAKEILKSVLLSCKSDGYVYFPAGYRESPLNSGHQIVLYIKLSKEIVTVFLLNLGEGVNQHLQVGLNGGLTFEFSFRYFPIEFKTEEFFGEMGVDIFSRLLRLQIEPPLEQTRPYSAQDVYALFTTYGTVKNHFDISPLRWKKTPHIGNTCADKAVEMVIRDTLLENGYPRETIKRLFCSERLFSLISFYHEISESKDLNCWTKLALGIRELSIHLDNLPSELLAEEERLICETILATLKRRVELRKSFLNDPEKSPSFSNLPLAAFESEESSANNDAAQENVITKESENSFADSAHPIGKLSLPPPPPFKSTDSENFHLLLTQWSDYHFHCQGIDKNRARNFLYQAFMSLPIPTHQADDFWAMIPPDKISSIIQTITKMVSSSRETGNFKSTYRAKLIANTAYAIVDCLVRRLDERMKGFHPLSFLLPGNKVDPREIFLPLGGENKRVSDLFDYFNSLKLQHPESCFHFAPSINISEARNSFIANLLSSPVPQTLESHLKFLIRFFPAALEEGLSSNLSYEAQLAKIWCQHLPVEIQCLEKICFLALGFNRDASKPQDPLRVAKKVSLREEPWVIFDECRHVHEDENSKESSNFFFSFHQLVKYPVISSNLGWSFFHTTKNSNIALTLPQEGIWESQKFYKEWMRIYSNPSLQVSSALTWGQNHFPEFGNALIRASFEGALFGSNLLQQQLIHEPRFEDWLRKFVARGIEFFQKTPNDSAFLFFIRLGTCFETQIANAFQRSIDAEMLRHYAAQLNSSSPLSPTFLGLWDAHLLFIYNYLLPNDKESLSRLVLSHFRLRYLYTYSSVSLGRPGGTYLENYNEDHPSYSPDWPLFEAKKCALNLAEELLQASKDSQWVKELESRVCALLKIPHTSDIKLDLENLVLWKDQCYLNRKKNEQNWSQHYELFWVNPQSSTSTLLTADSKSAFAVQPKDEIRLFFKKGSPEIENLHFFFQQRFFIAPEGIEIWGEKTTQRVSRIKIVDVDLEFQGKFVRDSWRLECVQHPKYYIAESQALTVSRPFSHGLIIENSSGKKLVLFLDKDRVSGRRVCHLFSYHLEQDLLQSEDPRANSWLVLHFAWQKDYYNAKRYLSRCHSYKSHNQRDDTLFQYLSTSTFHSSEALAFKLHVGLHLFREHTQLVLKNFGPEQQRSINSCFHFYCMRIAEIYTDYLSHISANESTRVPDILRLTLQEEKEICHFLLQYLSDSSLNDEIVEKARILIEKFTLRKTQLERGQVSHSIYSIEYTPYPKELIGNCFTLTDLSSLKYESFQFNVDSPLPMKSFVRVKTAVLLEYFPWFYGRAQRGLLKPVDFYYLACSEGSPSFINQYMTILFYINKYPAAFSHLSFGSRDSQAVFSDILDLCNSFLAKFYQVSAASVSLLKKSFLYPFYTSTTLKLPPSLPYKKVAFSWAEPEIKTLARASKLAFRELTKSEITFKPPAQARIKKKTSFKPSSSMTPSERDLALEQARGEEIYQRERESLPQLELTTASSLANLISKTQGLIEIYQREVANLKMEIETLANQLPDYRGASAAIRSLRLKLSLRQIGDDIQKIGLNLLTSAYVKRDATAIQSRNPSLTPQQVKRLLGLIGNYHFKLVLCERLQQAKSLLEKKGEQGITEFVELCHRDDFATLLEHPQFLVFSSRTKKTYRTSQIHLLQWYTQNLGVSRKVIAFPAGGGKTDLFLPLAVETALFSGESVVVVSPQSLSLLDREKLNHSRTLTFDGSLEAWELEIKTVMDEQDLENIYTKLCKYIENNIPIHVTPLTLSAAHLQYRLALDNKEEKKVLWWGRIFDLYSSVSRTSTAFFEECRQTLNPLSQAKVGIGAPRSLPFDEQKLFIEIYRLLRNITQKLDVPQIFTLESADQSELSLDEIQQIRKNLAESVVKLPLFALSASDQTKAQDYLLTPTRLTSSNFNHLIDLTHYFMWDLLGEIVRLVPNIDHTQSSSPHEEFDLPAYKGVCSGAYYEIPYVTLALTIQRTMQTGLTPGQCEKFAREALKKHRSAFLSEKVGQKSPIETLLESWLSKPITIYNSKKLAEDLLAVRHHPEVIFWYLEECVLNAIVFTPEQILVTHLHLLHTFHKTVAFSATPGIPEIYGIYQKEDKDKNVYADITFAPKVLQKLKAPENQTVLKVTSLPKRKAFDCFKEILELQPQLFDRLELICDAGGLFRFQNEEQVAEDFVQFLKENSKKVAYDGIIYFSNLAKASKELVFWDLKKNCKSPLTSGEIVGSLDSLGYEWHKLKLLTICPLNEIIGFNGAFSETATTLVLVGENFVQSDLIQVVMRPRGFLNQKQSIVWVINQRFAARLEKSFNMPCSSELFIEWSRVNEGRKIEQEALAHSFAAIDFIMEYPLIEKLQGAVDSPKKQIALWHSHRSGVVKPFKLKAYLTPLKKENTEDVLWKYAEQCYEAYGYNTPWALAFGIKKQVENVIEGMKNRVTQIQSRLSHQQILKQTHVHQQQRTEKIQETHGSNNLQPESPNPLKFLRPDDPHFLKQLQSSSLLLKEVFQSKGLSPNLYITSDALHTAKSRGSSLGLKFFKPVRFILCIQDATQTYAFALSDEETVLIKRILLLEPIRMSNLKLVLLNSDGDLIKNGTANLGFTDAELETFIQSERVVDFLIDINLISMEVFQVERLRKRMENWEDIWPLWLQIKKSYPFTQIEFPTFIENLIPSRFKNLPAASASQKNWFSKIFFS